MDFDKYDDCSSDYQAADKSDIVLNVDGIKYSFDAMCAIVEFSKSHTFFSLRGRCRQTKHKEQLYRIKQYVDAQGTKAQNLQCVDDFVYMEFIRATECYLPIHGSILTHSRRFSFCMETGRDTHYHGE